MIDVRVGQDDGIQLSRCAVKLFVLWPSIFIGPLKQTAVQQKASRIRFHQVLASRDFAGCSKERNFHLVITCSVYFELDILLRWV